MARFLSREWFDELDRASGEAEEMSSSLADRARPDVAVEQQPGGEASLGVEPLCVGEGQDVGEAQDVGETLHVGEPDLVVDVVVSGTPEGEVRYQLVVDGDRARILSHEPGFWPAAGRAGQRLRHNGRLGFRPDLGARGSVQRAGTPVRRYGSTVL